MKDINKVILLGRLGANPVRRYTKLGTPVVHFPVATKRRVGKETVMAPNSLSNSPILVVNENAEFIESSRSPMNLGASEDSSFDFHVDTQNSGEESNGSSPPATPAPPQPIKPPYVAKSPEETQWHQIVSWGKLAENCAQYLRKGNSVYVEGSLRSRAYSDKAGIQKWAIEIHAETISFLGGPQ